MLNTYNNKGSYIYFLCSAQRYIGNNGSYFFIAPLSHSTEQGKMSFTFESAHCSISPLQRYYSSSNFPKFVNHTNTSTEQLNKMSKKLNILTMIEIRQLKNNWNDYGAKPFHKKLCNIVAELIEKVIVQPKIFPTANNSIQFEYYDRENSNKYLEFEIFDNIVKMFKINGEKQNEQVTMSVEISKINNIIGTFYGLDERAK